MAEVLVVGKKISEMDLVTDIVGDEKIPTGVVGDKAVTTGQLLTYLDNNGKVQWGRIEGDIANQADLQNQFTQERDTLKSYTQEQVSQQQVALQEHIGLTNEAFKYARDNGSALPYKEGTTYEENAVVVKDGVLQQWKGGEWEPVVAASLSDTIQTFNTPEAGVDPITGVADGAYFNVRSSSGESYADEYQNIGGVPTPSGKSCPSGAALTEVKEAIIDPATNKATAEKVFTKSGVSLEEKTAERVSVKDYGALGMGLTNTLQDWTIIGSRPYYPDLAAIKVDYPNATALTNYIDRVAIQKCIDDCMASGKIAHGVSGEIYAIDAPIKMYSNADFTDSTFKVAPSYNTQVIRISSTDLGVNLLSFLNIKLPSVLNDRAVGSIPTGGGVGVFLEGVRNSSICFTGDVRGFETNFKLYSNDVNKYISYNDFYFNGAALRGAKNNILIDVAGTGWINQCQWFGGQFAQFTADSAAFETRGLLVRKTVGGNNAPNGHTFYGCSMEGAYTYTLDFDYDTSITTSFFSMNRFNDCRFEAAVKFRFNQYSLYDAMNNCYVPDSAVFEGDIYPDEMNGCGRFANKAIDVAALETSSGFRTSRRTYMHQGKNSAVSVPLSTGFQGRLNGGIRANGNHVVYDAADETRAYPTVEMGKMGGTPSLNFGSGVAAPTDRIYWNAAGDLRHNAAISPSTNNTFDLGVSGRGYKTLWSNNARFTQGFSAWATVPPASKPSITGKINPTTITEQNAVLSSIVSALLAYGLVSDDRTA